MRTPKYLEHGYVSFADVPQMARGVPRLRLPVDLSHLQVSFPSQGDDQRARKLPLSMTMRMIPGDETVSTFRRAARPPMPGSGPPRGVMIRHMNVAGQKFQL
jgi:hypothetical protein